MRIAVVYHRDERGNAYGMYVSEILSNYAEWLGYKLYSYHNFDDTVKNKLPKNAVISIPVNLESQVGLRWFYKFKLPSLIKKANADIFICINGIGSVSVQKPQILVLPAGGYFQKTNEKKYPWQKFSKKFFGESLSKADKVISSSANILETLEKKVEKKIQNSALIPLTATSIFKELTWGERVLAKAQFTGNKEFFICIIVGENEDPYIDTLKAFSIFKKWQRSSMQLLFISENDFLAESFMEKLASYKYRDDVQVLQNLAQNQTTDLMASAYALLYPQKKEGDLLPLLESMQSAVPIIAYKHEPAESYCSQAAMYAKESTHESFAEQMIYLYKNENKRSEMIECCKEQSKLYNRDNVSADFWAIIEAVVKLDK